MKCEFCELAMSCTSPDAYYGGCDMDGVDDRVCRPLEDLMEANEEDGCDRDFEEFRDDDNGF